MVDIKSDKAHGLTEEAKPSNEPTPQAISENLAQLRSAVGYLTRHARYQDAIKAAEQLLQMTEGDFGHDSSEVAEVIGRIGLLHSYIGERSLAEKYYKQALMIFEKRPGQGRREFLTLMSNLGMLYFRAKRFKEAEPVLARALELAQKQLAGDPDLAFSYNNLGLLYFDLDQYDKAESLLKTALEIREASSNVDADLIAISLDNLGQVYLETQRYVQARQCFARGLCLFEQSLGETHPDTLICLRNLATLFQHTGDDTKALELLSGAVESCRAVSPKENSQVESQVEALLQERGILYRANRLLALAEADLRRALCISEARGGSDAADRTAGILSELAAVYMDARDYVQADATLAREQEIREQLLDSDPASAALLYARRGWVQLQRQDPSSSKNYYLKALEIDVKAYGLTHPSVAKDLNNLSLAQMSLEEYSEAKASLEKAITINRELEPNRDTCDIASNYNNLGAVEERLGNSEQAEAAYRRSVGIFTHLLGSDQPDTANAECNLGLLLLSCGKTKEALEAGEAYCAAFERNLGDLLAFGTERQRTSFRNSQSPFSFFATLGEADLLAAAILKYKGLLTDSMMADRTQDGASAAPGIREGLKRWQDARRRLTQDILEESVMDSVDDPEARDRRRNEHDHLLAELSEAENALIGQKAGIALARSAFSLKVSDVQARIPGGSVLLEFIRYNHYLGKAKWEARYGVVIVRSQGPSDWVPLGPAWDIEQAVDIYDRIVRGIPDPINSVEAPLRTLYGLLVEPAISRLLTEATHLLISPDGALNFISFGTLLMADDSFLAEKYRITYLASGRHLLRKGSGPRTKTMLILENPIFRLRPESQDTTRTKAGSPAPFSDASFPVLCPLQSAGEESASIKDIAVENGWQVTHLTAEKATEEALRTASKPGIIHLATHGFYLPRYGTELVPDEPLAGSKHGAITSIKCMSAKDVALEDPMHRSAVALAGAEDTLEAWRNGEVPEIESDGILNAEEAAVLDLYGTWLITLSSCDSGRGEAVPSEGVLGLRRGFLVAGVQHVLTTLWPIDDETSASIMKAFYQKALPSADAPGALAEIQRDFMKKMREEYGIYEALAMAGAFVITSQIAPH